jgi:Zn-dependent M28 family amino/carboxypeptidase
MIIHRHRAAIAASVATGVVAAAALFALFALFAPDALAQRTGSSLPAIDSASLWNTLGALSADSMQGRRMGTPGNAAARSLIVRRLTAAGLVPLAPGYVQAFAVKGRDTTVREGVNVLAMVRGADTSRVLVVSAHYDHLGVRDGQLFNGTDDNASGTAAVLAMAAYFARNPPRHSIIFAFWDGEESGLRGARAFVAAPPLPLARVAANVNLDMVARLDKNEMYAAGASPYPFFRPLLEATAAVAPVKLLLGHDTDAQGNGENWTNQSDQGAFHAAGVPFIYFGVEDHADYHRATDDFAKVDAARYVGAVRTIADFVRRLDQALDATVKDRRD